MNQLPECIPDLLAEVTWGDLLRCAGHRDRAKARAEERAKLRRVLWRGLDGRVDRAYNPRLVAE